MLRKERQAESSPAESNDVCQISETTKPPSDENIKRKLIMKTIEDIKRSLEDQSLELNELHDSDN